MAFRKSSDDRSYCYIGAHIPQGTLSKETLASLEDAIKTLAHKEVGLVGLTRGKAIWDEDGELLCSDLLIGKKLQSVSRDQTKHFALKSATKTRTLFCDEQGPFASLQQLVSAELRPLLAPQKIHLFLVGSFTRLLWGELCMNGPYEPAKVQHIKEVRANHSNHFWDDPSVVMGVQLGETDSSKTGWSQTLDLEQAQARMEEATLAGFPKPWSKNLFLIDLTWWAH